MRASGDRALGSPGYEAAAQYVEQQLQGAGSERSRQYFTVQDHGEEVTTLNIIAETQTCSEDNVIMLGAGPEHRYRWDRNVIFGDTGDPHPCPWICSESL